MLGFAIHFYCLTRDKLSLIYWTNFRSFFTKWKVFAWICFIRTSFFLIPQGTLPWESILGKIREITFMQHAGVSKRIRLLQFWFKFGKEQYFCYILCNFDEDRSTSFRDNARSFCNFWEKMAKIDIFYKNLSKFWTKLTNFSAHLGGQIATKPKFWCEQVFSSQRSHILKHQYYQNSMALIRTKFCIVIGTTEYSL